MNDVVLMLEDALMACNFHLEEAFIALDQVPNPQIKGLNYSDIIIDILNTLNKVDDCMFKIDTIKEEDKSYVCN